METPPAPEQPAVKARPDPDLLARLNVSSVVVMTECDGSGLDTAGNEIEEQTKRLVFNNITAPSNHFYVDIETDSGRINESEKLSENSAHSELAQEKDIDCNSRFATS